MMKKFEKKIYDILKLEFDKSVGYNEQFERVAKEIVEPLENPAFIGNYPNKVAKATIKEFKECFDYLQLTDFQRENIIDLLLPRLRKALRNYPNYLNN